MTLKSDLCLRLRSPLDPRWQPRLGGDGVDERREIDREDRVCDGPAAAAAAAVVVTVPLPQAQ